MIVDHQLRAVAGAHREGFADFLPHFIVRPVLDAQLDQFHAGRHDPPHPVGAVDDGVEGRQRAHPSEAMPISGVDGAAMSRGCIGWASNAARPASIALANAPAMATGSPALATAVFSSTAS